MKVREKNLILIFSPFFRIFSYDFIVYFHFAYVATSSTEIDDLTKLVMYRIFNTNLQYSVSFLHIFWAKILNF